MPSPESLTSPSTEDPEHMEGASPKPRFVPDRTRVETGEGQIMLQKLGLQRGDEFAFLICPETREKIAIRITGRDAST